MLAAQDAFQKRVPYYPTSVGGKCKPGILHGGSLCILDVVNKFRSIVQVIHCIIQAQYFRKFVVIGNATLLCGLRKRVISCCSILI